MPVVIRELHVKVNVEEEKKDRSQRTGSRPNRIDSDALIDACVEKVVEIMKQENRR
ncbi:DUF5908 family protein [Rhodohalobacter sulfatireducens]|uniref:DUF5908 family protein n=1 Tax=Rhodohalobacter sulfatireducens TaxID=2911366 RepID=A0ABS9KGH1_9BACT|nr:DUF5908 family protein [Rhodohalobacter sulfatireducens]MCG2589944.1 DUF5908 family protein [Rhodohalobacter sulfatireducens]